MGYETFRCGHEKSPENTRTTGGKKKCRKCDRAHARRWKDSHREQQLQYNREYGVAPENRGICESPICTRLRGTKALRRSRVSSEPRGYCAECVQAVADARRTLVEGMWADGWTTYEITAALGVSASYLQARRAHGWDLPHRRTAEQVERIRAARWDGVKSSA